MPSGLRDPLRFVVSHLAAWMVMSTDGRIHVASYDAAGNLDLYPTLDLWTGLSSQGGDFHWADECMSSSKLKPQSAAERRSTEVAVRSLIARFASSDERLVGAARRWIRKRLPTAHELVYEYRSWFVISYSPSEHGYEGVIAIRGDADGVKLFLNRGKDLSDPEKLLKGSGKQMRWMPLDRASTLARPEIVRLIDDAIALNQVPFASSGQGSLVLRAASSR